METLDTSIQVFNPREPIAGYALQERIGSGGFGEVWKAVAPGGLSKAVKIVYGQMNASKAERELKALNRVKQVHHPMLLSLERIEIVDGHLVIVTELADCSLMDRFGQHVQEGRRGIPRAELLLYLQDAADALDFLYEEHSLQHLDVKPENLLLLANRIKVADFGMVKDLQENNETMIGGLTPLYAPPEIYDGQPTRNSDQYSLAIVYQQMLTAELPFAGRTAAQLAAQHLHSDPDLSSLVDSDRRVIGRALSKDPRRRFASCRELVATLAEPPRAVQVSTPRRHRNSPSAQRFTERRSVATSTISVPATWPCATTVETLPALPPVSCDAATLPAVFVGVGEMAAQTLRLLKRQIASRFTSLEKLPAIQFRLLDTDASTLTDATRGDRSSALRLNETIALPLREAAYYRTKSDALLEWLHRRWLYNIPRTLRTEGLRSLGRLAFVDHYPTIEQSLRETILSATAQEAVQQTSRTCGRPFCSDRVQVFVIGSATGGTSSGLVLDLAYALRHLLSELRLADDDLYGVLMSGTRAGGCSRDLQVANALALLRELAYLSSAGSQYPGEPDCGIPEFTARKAPFAHTYLVDLGSNVSSREFHAQAENVAQYLFASSLSAAAPYFAVDRQETRYREFPARQCRIRTVSLANIGGNAPATAEAAESICRALVRRWGGENPQTHVAARGLESLAERFAKGLDLEADSLRRLGGELLGSPFVEDPSHLLRTLASCAQRQRRSEANELDLAEALEALDRAFLEPHEETRLALDWQQQVSRRLKSDAEQRIDAIQEWLAMLARQPGVQPHGVRQVVSWFLQYLANLEGQLFQAADAYLLPKEAGREPQPRVSWLELAEQRWQWMVWRHLATYVRNVRNFLQEFNVQWNSLLRRLEEFAVEFSVNEAQHDDSEESQLIELRRWQLVESLDDAVKTSSLAAQDAWSSMMRAPATKWRELAASMREHATGLVAETLSKQKLAQLVQAEAHGSSARNDQVAEWLRSVRPRLRCCGGKERALVLVPGRDDAAQKSLASLLQETEFKDATLIPVTDERMTVVFELSDLPLENVMVHLAGGRKEYFELAARLHARKDVDWGQ